MVFKAVLIKVKKNPKAVKYKNTIDIGLSKYKLIKISGILLIFKSLKYKNQKMYLTNQLLLNDSFLLDR